ncbi:hypothetical protein RB653_008027 [Dictyostelium firmibasis]|uniref:Uncharacterized protein n=1 Tax=Dictyostelium firmibasis TaxID=79012 RepID=A0AAN7TQD7_9MYCE
MQHLKKYIKTCRPIQSSCVIFSILTAIAYGYSFCGDGGNSCEEFNIPLTIVCSIVSILIFQYGYIINSVIDYLTGVDDEKTFDRTLFDSNNSLGDLYKYCFAILSIIVLSCIFPIHWFSKSTDSYWLLVKLIFVELFFMSTYTFSKYIGLGGFFFSICYWAPVSYVYLALTNNYVSMFNFEHPLMICALMEILFAHAAILTNCIRDYETDRDAGIYTMVRLVGLKISFLLLLSIYFVVYVLQFHLMLTYQNYYFSLPIILFSFGCFFFYKKYLKYGRSIMSWYNGFIFVLTMASYNFAIFFNNWNI